MLYSKLLKCHCGLDPQSKTLKCDINYQYFIKKHYLNLLNNNVLEYIRLRDKMRNDSSIFFSTLFEIRIIIF